MVLLVAQKMIINTIIDTINKNLNINIKLLIKISSIKMQRKCVSATQDYFPSYYT